VKKSEDLERKKYIEKTMYHNLDLQKTIRSRYECV